MRRLITTLAILFVVLVAGMTALVLLVNPNDFRNYMVQQVEQRSGYQLRIEGDLRWHVWPQLSILAGRMSVTAPGAQQPLVAAENMRLDVHLFPLLSHQLSVKQVMLKNAVFRLTPESAAQQPPDAPTAPAGTVLPEASSGWKFDISSLQVADSLLIWRQPQGEEINFRDVNLSMSQNDRRQATLSLAARVSRDQCQLQLTLNGEMNVADYPQRITGNIDELNWQLKGPGLPAAGLEGKSRLEAEWQDKGQRFALRNLFLTLGESELSGAISGHLGDTPDIALALHSPRLDLDALSGVTAESQTASAAIAPVGDRAPVIAERASLSYADSPLSAMTARLELQADTLRWRGLDLQQVNIDAQNRQGLVTLSALRGRYGAGTFSLPGTLDLRAEPARAALRPQLQRVAIAPLLHAFMLPETLTGELTLEGTLGGPGLSVAAFRHDWQGDTRLTLNNASLIGMNIQQLVQRNVTHNSDRIRAAGEAGESNESRIDRLQAQAALRNGVIALNNVQGSAKQFSLSGAGQVDMTRRQSDMTFGVKVTGGWQGDSDLIAQLRQTAVPLRIYGKWDSLQYQLQVDRLLRKRLEDAAKSRLDEWSQRHPNNDKRDSLN